MKPDTHRAPPSEGERDGVPKQVVATRSRSGLGKSVYAEFVRSSKKIGHGATVRAVMEKVFPPPSEAEIDRMMRRVAEHSAGKSAIESSRPSKRRSDPPSDGLTSRALVTLRNVLREGVAAAGWVREIARILRAPAQFWLYDDRHELVELVVGIGDGGLEELPRARHRLKSALDAKPASNALLVGTFRRAAGLGRNLRVECVVRGERPVGFFVLDGRFENRALIAAASEILLSALEADHAKRLAAIRDDMVACAASTGDLGAFQRVVVHELARRHLGAAAASLFLVNPRSLPADGRSSELRAHVGQLELVETTGLHDPAPLHSVVYPPGEGLTGRIWSEGAVQRLPCDEDEYTEYLVSVARPTFKPKFASRERVRGVRRQFLGVPLREASKVRGVLRCVGKQDDTSFSIFDEEAAVAFASEFTQQLSLLERQVATTVSAAELARGNRFRFPPEDKEAVECVLRAFVNPLGLGFEYAAFWRFDPRRRSLEPFRCIRGPQSLDHRTTVLAGTNRRVPGPEREGMSFPVEEVASFCDLKVADIERGQDVISEHLREAPARLPDATHPIRLRSLDLSVPVNRQLVGIVSPHSSASALVVQVSKGSKRFGVLFCCRDRSEGEPDDEKIRFVEEHAQQLATSLWLGQVARDSAVQSRLESLLARGGDSGVLTSHLLGLLAGDLGIDKVALYGVNQHMAHALGALGYDLQSIPRNVIIPFWSTIAQDDEVIAHEWAKHFETQQETTVLPLRTGDELLGILVVGGTNANPETRDRLASLRAVLAVAVDKLQRMRRQERYEHAVSALTTFGTPFPDFPNGRPDDGFLEAERSAAYDLMRSLKLDLCVFSTWVGRQAVSSDPVGLEMRAGLPNTPAQVYDPEKWPEHHRLAAMPTLALPADNDTLAARPLRGPDGAVLGRVVVGRLKENAAGSILGRDGARIVDNLAQAIGAHLSEQQWRHDERERSTRQETLLSHASQLLEREPPADPRDVAELAKKVLEADLCILYRYDPDRGVESTTGIAGTMGRPLEPDPNPLSSRLVMAIKDWRSTLFTSDAPAVEAPSHLGHFAEAERIVSFVVVPIVAAGRRWVLFANYREKHAWLEKDLMIFNFFAALVAPAVRRFDVDLVEPPDLNVVPIRASMR